MAQVPVKIVDGKNSGAGSILEEIKAVWDRVRQRAHEIFERRNGGEGSQIDDWLSAERELLIVPDFEFSDKDGKVEIRVKVADFEAADLTVAAFPEALIVKATRANGNGEKTLLTRFDLPDEIDVDNVLAVLDKDVLRVGAQKRAQSAPGMGAR